MSFMPGFFPAGAAEAAAAAGVVTSIVQQASATSLASTITAPADIQAGDVLVLFDTGYNAASNPASVIPSGFSSAVDTNGGVPGIGRNVCSYKLATGAEASASLTGMSATNIRKALLVFRPNVPATLVTVGDQAGEVTVNNPSAQTVNVASVQAPLIILGAYSGLENGTAVDPRTFTVGGVGAKDGEINANSFAYLAWKIYNSSPADAVIDMDDEGNGNGLQSFYLQVS